MGRLVKCAFCGEMVDKDVAIRFEDKNFHDFCVEEHKAKKEVYAYVAKVFKFKSENRPGPKIISQLKTFREKYGYSYRDILCALQFHFDIQKGSVKNANEGIGIVPYVMDQAIEFYTKLTKRQERIAENLTKQIESEEVNTIVVKARPRKEKKTIDLESI